MFYTGNWNTKVAYVPDFVIEKLGDTLKVAREEKGFSRLELSKHVGLHRCLIDKYERRQSTPTPKSYNKLAAFFGWQLWKGDV